MSIRLRRKAVLGVVAAAAVVVGAAAPAGANAGTLYSATPLNGWGHDGTAYGVDIFEDVVYVGGSFANAVRFTQVQAHANLMAVQRSTGTVIGSFNPSTDATVRAVVADNSFLYVGGDFLTVNGQGRQRIAKLNRNNGSLVQTWNVPVNKPVRDLLLVGNTLYLVGDFTKVHNVTRNRAAAVDATSGALLAFNPNLTNPGFGVKTYAVAANPSGTRVYVGGNFAVVGGTPRSFMAQVDPVSGALQGPAFAQLNDLVLDLSVTDSQVFAGVDGGMNSAAAWNPTTGQRQWRLQANGDVQAVEYSNGNVYFGFHDGFNGNTTLRVLAADAASGTLETAFQPVSGGGVGVWGIEADGDYLAVVGKFPKMGGFNVKGVSIHP
jgi:hypothetical protein